MSNNIKAKYSSTIISPRVTEKATKLLEKNVYAFSIDPNSNKRTVIEAIKAYYNVVPEKVRIVKNPSKNIFVRGKRGVKSGVKKAYVYLKKGDKME